ncbi:hypothetical protein B0H21DRAFT_817780 [Amylocystis lapponica]|nr:hypothetical protein B0H21DRAFT_817780 [Amylocystis lapponica]
MDESTPQESGTSSTSVQSPVDRLSSEIHDRIIDFLYNDRAALYSCALTYRTWVPSARYHLFNTIVLRGYRMTALRAFDCLLNTSPYLGQLVEDLSLDVTWEDEGRGAALLSSIAPRLGRVRTLKLDSYGSYTVDYATYSQFGPVVDLSVDITHTGHDDVGRLFRAFPNIEKLYLRSLRVRDDTTAHDVSVPLPSLPALRNLRVDVSMDFHPTMAELCLSPLTVLDSFTMILQTWEQIATLANILSVIGCTLRHLTVHFVFNIKGASASGETEVARLAEKISACTSLHSVYYTSTKPIDDLTDFLAQIKCSNIKSMTLDAFINDETQANVSALDQLFLPLTRIQSRDAQKILLRLRWKVWIPHLKPLAEQVAWDIHKRLPGLYGRNVSTVVAGSSKPIFYDLNIDVYDLGSSPPHISTYN